LIYLNQKLKIQVCAVA